MILLLASPPVTVAVGSATPSAVYQLANQPPAASLSAARPSNSAAKHRRSSLTSAVVAVAAMWRNLRPVAQFGGRAPIDRSPGESTRCPRQLGALSRQKCLSCLAPKHVQFLVAAGIRCLFTGAVIVKAHQQPLTKHYRRRTDLDQCKPGILGDAVVWIGVCP